MCVVVVVVVVFFYFLLSFFLSVCLSVCEFVSLSLIHLSECLNHTVCVCLSSTQLG